VVQWEGNDGSAVDVRRMVGWEAQRSGWVTLEAVRGFALSFDRSKKIEELLSKQQRGTVFKMPEEPQIERRARIEGGKQRKVLGAGIGTDSSQSAASPRDRILPSCPRAQRGLQRVFEVLEIFN
jgi:hypothetical protein